ncbi:MAG: hypothetical protein GY847_08475 [Proteobacteria bacterium]|nr:hypothetical protein [Pseudomonadota bacterium]
MKRLFLLVLFFTGCSTAGLKHDPMYHSTLVSSHWEPLVPRRSPSSHTPADRPASSEPTSSEPNDIRARMVTEAKALLAKGNRQGGYGTADLSTMLAKVGSKVSWRSGQSLDALTSLARRKDAFHLEDDPIPGDIVLFHNQWDANLNGEADDWLTGCGVIIEKHGARFEAVVRTGHAPRRVSVRPDGPSQQVVDDEKVNSFLRVPSRSDSSDTAYLADQLYAGYIDIEELTEGSGK